MIRATVITSLVLIAVSTAEAGPKTQYGWRCSVYAYKAGKTASGERVASSAMTAAHRSLPFGTKVRVQINDLEKASSSGLMIAVRLSRPGNRSDTSGSKSAWIFRSGSCRASRRQLT